MIKRYLETIIESKIGKGKAIIIFGARQVGKTTMLKNLLAGRDDVLWLNGDEQDIRNIFENTSSTMLKTVIGKISVIVIDEAQPPPTCTNHAMQEGGLRFPYHIT